MRRRARDGKPFAIIMGLYVVLTFAYSLLLPLGEAPDEPGHYNYARVVAWEQRLPQGDEEHEAFQPPLYYWLAAPLAGLGDASQLPLKGNADFTLAPGGPHNLLLHTKEEAFPYSGWAVSWHIVRSFSILCGLITLRGLLRLSHLTTGSQNIGMVASSLFVLAPSFTLLHGAASNDTLALALGTMLFGEVALLVKRAPRGRRLMLVGILWGLAVLSKASMLAAGAGIGLAVLLARLRQGGQHHLLRALWDVALVSLGVASVCGWWFVRNTFLYGDPLGWQLIYAINEQRAGAVNWAGEVAGLWRSYWLGYVGMNLPNWLYLALLLPLALSLTGLTKLAISRGRVLASPAVTVVFLVYVFAFAVSWVRWTLTVEGTDQARLLYPALVAAMPALAVGMLAWAAPQSQRRVAWLTVALMVVLNLYALTSRVLPVFTPPERLRLSDVPTIGQRVDFGGRIILLAYDLPPAVAAGDTLIIHTWWSALAATSDDIWLTLRMVSAEGKVPVWKRGSPSAGRDSTDRWPADVAILAEHRLRLPPDLPPGTYTLEAGLQVFGQEAWLPAAVDGQEPRELWPLGNVMVRAPAIATDQADMVFSNR
ncbi:MAG: hypothetical protein ACUVWR_03175 [Anaerolineae bacterium]